MSCFKERVKDIIGVMQSRGGEERVITDGGEREKTTEGRERKRRRGERENDGGE